MLSVPGIGSGLDVSALVDGLVSAEGDAKTQLLATRRNDISSEVSAFGALKNALESLHTATTTLATNSTYTDFSATSGNTDFFTVSATSQATAGNYDIEIRQLAEAHKLLSPGLADAETDVGTGTLSIGINGESFDVVIDSDNQTLSGIRNAINNATDNIGVSATLLTVDDGSGGTLTKLVLTANETGEENAISINVTDDDGNHTDANGLSIFYFDTADATTPEQMTEINEAIDAEIYIDSQRILSASNIISEALEGITLTLKQAEAGTNNSLVIATDINNARNSIESFVNAYNNFASLADSLSDFNADTGATGILIGDATLRTLSNAVLEDITYTLPGLSNEFSNLVDLGITTNENGLLEIDSAILTDALTNNSADVEVLFASDNGIATQLDTLLTQYTQSNGIIDSKTEGLNETIEDIDEDLVTLNRSLETLEARLLEQFTALDIILTQLNSTSSFLTQQFEQIQNITSQITQR